MVSSEICGLSSSNEAIAAFGRMKAVQGFIFLTHISVKKKTMNTELWTDVFAIQGQNWKRLDGDFWAFHSSQIEWHTSTFSINIFIAKTIAFRCKSQPACRHLVTSAAPDSRARYDKIFSSFSPELCKYFKCSTGCRCLSDLGMLKQVHLFDLLFTLNERHMRCY